uniref:Uncharacterized protein n=1 Tax=Rhizophora mucronata TaxID=61149 RepID=A0A2P2PX34_RHIMU
MGYFLNVLSLLSQLVGPFFSVFFCVCVRLCSVFHFILLLKLDHWFSIVRNMCEMLERF